jgi:hypothetical protein
VTIIDSEACFLAWAPDGAVWSPWAKPTIFAAAPVFVPDTLPAAISPALEIPGLPDDWTPSAIVVDLPGAESVNAGLMLAARGFRPVPLFNGTVGPRPVIDNEPIASALGVGAGVLPTLALKLDARPAFLLDSRRLDPTGSGIPGHYDNRWVTLPQDFPSAVFLQSHGIAHVTLIVADSDGPLSDLKHIARRWQDAGLTIRLIDRRAGTVTDSYDVPTPTLFKRAWYAAAMLMGLRRNNVGGFGSTIPEQTQSSGFYG